MNSYKSLTHKIHRLIPSKFPPIQLFDWAETKEELEQIAALEGLTNPRIIDEIGNINLVPRDEWIGGEGTTAIMAAFTHVGYPSRFSNGSYGVYYAANSVETAIRETIFHRERFYQASNEAPCSISMREYITQVIQPLVELNPLHHPECFNPEPDCYEVSQEIAFDLKTKKEWGIYYPSVRDKGGKCVAIFRPKALKYPVLQGAHYKYLWDGSSIYDVYKENKLKNIV
jgi:hypothetical protein